MNTLITAAMAATVLAWTIRWAVGIARTIHRHHTGGTR